MIAKKIKLDEEQQVRGFLAILKLIHVPLQAIAMEVVTPENVVEDYLALLLEDVECLR